MDASPSFSSLWPLLQDHYHPRESVEEVKQRLVAATVELEAAREEVRRKEQSIARLVELVRRTAKERDELRQLLLLAREQPVVTTTSSGSDSDKSLAPTSPVAVESLAAVDRLELLAAATKRPLPQQGRLLQAVMEAGPLLQNLMVAGPLPRWRNPPPSQALPSPVIQSPPSYSCAPNPMAG